MDTIERDWLLPMHQQVAHYLPLVGHPTAAAACGRRYYPNACIVAPGWTVKCGACLQSLVRQLQYEDCNT
jgi:hypothetical protein